jgi:signal transduction histidine kinase
VLLNFPLADKPDRWFMPPILSEGNNLALHLDSALHELPLYRFQVEISCLGTELAQVFEQYPLLPGAVLVDQGQYVGMISRRRFLEYLLRPQGTELFLKHPLRVLYSYARSEVLLLPADLPIVTAAHQALRRSPEFLGEPVVVQTGSFSYLLLDIHALNIAYWQIRGVETQVRYERTQAQMIQSDKMANLGRLVDGVAHEILDPISFIWGNLSHLMDYSKGLLELLTAYEKYLPNPPAEIIQIREDQEFDYLCEDFPRTVESIRTGAERLSKLATSLQNFCHIDEVYPKPADLHGLLDGILLLLKSRLTSELQVVKHYSHLPPVLCYPGQLNQVLMNILSNAVDALLNQAVSQHLQLDGRIGILQTLSPVRCFKPTITITTEVRSISLSSGDPSRWVYISIADNGPGLSAEVQQKILESFSIQKRAEKETSLAVSYQIITAKHGGRLEMRSRSLATGEQNGAAIVPADTEDNRTGTEFEIWLPLL